MYKHALWTAVLALFAMPVNVEAQVYVQGRGWVRPTYYGQYDPYGSVYQNQNQSLRTVTPSYAPIRTTTPTYTPFRTVTPSYTPFRTVTPSYAPYRTDGRVAPRYSNRY